MRTIDTPGVFADEMSHYLSDPLPEPGLSTGVVCDLLERTPMHAHWFHPRLGKHRKATSPRADLGSAIHSAILGGAEIVYIEANDWRTNAAKEERDKAHADGKIPLLAKQQILVQRATEAATRLLGNLGVGDAERSIYFKSGSVWLRGRSDWLGQMRMLDVDVKTVDSADPESFIRHAMFANGYDVQGGIRSLGHKALDAPREIVFLLVEIEAPYGASLVGMGNQLTEMAEAKVKHACAIWRRCLDEQKWPGYGSEIAWAEPPVFALRDLAERTGVTI